MPSNTSIQVVERISHLLDAIVSNDGRSTLKFLSADTGLHPSTAFRILKSLADYGFVEKDGEGYRIGRKLLHLSRHVRGGKALDTEAEPEMKWLRDEIGETVNLTIAQGDEVIYIGRVLSKRMMRVEQIIGSRAPLHVTAVGKLMLGESGEQGCRAYAARSGLVELTHNTITDVDTLVRCANEVRAAGYALDNEEAELGVGCIGVPIRDGRGQMVAGLSVSSPIERRRDEWIPKVIAAGQRISERIGSSGDVG
ncbi:IclR family transcriptional regulator [Thiohalomonas denitrificans]|uniref:HTH-type transcriptional repressor AllR n=1 Tax=Thiohalomonas denitrificans TaxID=415747 RepID=A0A1G5QJB3_9GAMM|nr:IclR family transcriptional regulator [Thiohalomonas denitrificans]SCZ61259.1 transcriptional regulator, IclR family [Thiohalomonas denitrificans]